MSYAQEERRKAAWGHFHQESHEKSLDDLRAMKAKLDTLAPISEEYKAMKAKYDARYEAAESNFVKYNE